MMSDLNENIKKLKKHLDIIKEQGVLNVVDGELKNSNSRKKFSNFSPVDETYICEVAQVMLKILMRHHHHLKMLLKNGQKQVLLQGKKSYTK